MADDPAGSSPRLPGADEPRRTDSSTRGFLFADLRGYTNFVERRGAEQAARLLERYRDLVRSEIARLNGAEIRTEGDSFYVVFGSVTTAVRAGLAIAEAARDAAAGADEPIRVGIGVHAGETVETAEGFVGQPVNIAARVCAIAAPGEVLVTDTVRALTQTLLAVRFVPRGRRRLKGIAEPLAVFAAEPLAANLAWGGPRRSRRWAWRLALAGGTMALLAIVAVAWTLQRSAGLPPGAWTIGVALPTSGGAAEFAQPLRRAVDLALADAVAAGTVADGQLQIEVHDTGSPADFAEDPKRAAEIAQELVDDASVIGLIGPFQSFVAEAQIPITNEAGLLQCGPSTTDPKLTKPRAGALELRPADPRINFVRLPAAADIEAGAVAWFAFNELGAERALVIDDAQEVGRIVADGFEREFRELGGIVVRRALNPGGDPLDVLAPLGEPGAPSLVFFGGFTATGAHDVRRAMVEAGHGDVPFLGWDAMYDGSGDEEGSFIDLTGEAAAGSYVSHPTVGTIRADFERRYRDAYGESPARLSYEYAAAAYACAQIIIQALVGVAELSPSADELREAVRAFVTGPDNRFETVLGTIGFDANGDSTQQVVTFYRVDPAAANSEGDWVVIEQQDFGPAS